jgi:ribosomal protein S18 acetylase RimI-like enzyme
MSMREVDGEQPVFRGATVDDSAGVAEVFIAARAEMAYLPRLHTDDETRWWIEHVVVAECEVWVAEAAGRVVGFAALRGDWLDHLYVAPAFQAGGMGRALLDIAKRERPEGLHLHVFQQNTEAIRFYERHGFVLVERSDGSGNEERLPDAHYGWRVDAPES